MLTFQVAKLNKNHENCKKKKSKKNGLATEKVDGKINIKWKRGVDIETRPQLLISK